MNVGKPSERCRKTDIVKPFFEPFFPRSIEEVRLSYGIPIIHGSEHSENANLFRAVAENLKQAKVAKSILMSPHGSHHRKNDCFSKGEEIMFMLQSLSVLKKGIGAARFAWPFMAIAMFLPAANRVQAQPAPALTEIRVIAVASPAYKNGTAWDEVPAGAIATRNNHGGTWIRVAVLERGYGRNSMASWNGTRLTLYQSEPRFGADRRIWGYIRYYGVNTNFTSGVVTAQATSINSPVRTLSTRLTVQ